VGQQMLASPCPVKASALTAIIIAAAS
jgi:hypothetical protein